MEWVGRLGLEPRTHGLKVRCSTIELTPPRLTRALTCSFLLHIASDAVPLPSAAMVPQLRNGVAAASITRCCLAACTGVGEQESQDDYPASVRSLATFLAANDMPGHVDDVTTEGMPALVLSGRNKVSSPAPVKGGQLPLPQGRPVGEVAA
jgi:hypothetical protein